MPGDASNAEPSALPESLQVEARRLHIDIENRSEEQVRKAVGEAWIEENRDAVRSWNEWVEKNGLPLERYRVF